MIKKITLTLLFTSMVSEIFSQNLLNINNLVRYKDKYYKRFSMSPFTGKVFKLSKNTFSKILEAEIVDGLINGRYNEYYDFKKKKLKGVYVHGKPHGLFISWHYNGNQSSEIEFQDGQPIGVSYFWNENGMKTKEINNDTDVSTIWDYYNNKNKPNPIFSTFSHPFNQRAIIKLIVL